MVPLSSSKDILALDAALTGCVLRLDITLRSFQASSVEDQALPSFQTSLAHRSYIWLLLTVFLGSFETLVNEAEYAHQAHSKLDIESIPRRIASDWLYPLLQ